MPKTFGERQRLTHSSPALTQALNTALSSCEPHPLRVEGSMNRFLLPRSRNFLNWHSALRDGDKSNVPPTLFPHQSFPQPQYFQIVTHNLY